MAASSNGRFVLHSKEEIAKKQTESTPANTRRANEKAGRTFRAFLLERNGGRMTRVDFENFDIKVLDELLSEFWYAARTLKGEKYSASSLDNLRHSLSRYLRSSPHNREFDLTKDSEFLSSQAAFKGALRELKQEGKGAVNHHPEIVDEDLSKLYSHLDITTPLGLQEKVQFDERLYFFRRGSENMHTMKKNTFAVRKNLKTGERYVCKVIDELNKNHKEDCRESYSGFMPERKGNPNCPVASYLLYLEHLHPKCDELWARPKCDTSSDIWYYNRAVGVDKLRKFMKELSVKYGLSRAYTNHSIRVTGATILTRENYASSQIKEVTGHKSVSSLAIYQRVSENEKMEMGQKLTDKTLGSTTPSSCSHTAPSETPGSRPINSDLTTIELADIEALFGAEQSGNQPPQDTPSNSSPHVQSPESSNLQLTDMNLSPFLRDLVEDPYFEETSTTSTQQVVSSTNSQSQVLHRAHTVRVSPGLRPISFSGCTIDNLTVNLHPRAPEN